MMMLLVGHRRTEKRHHDKEELFAAQATNSRHDCFLACFFFTCFSAFSLKTTLFQVLSNEKLLRSKGQRSAVHETGFPRKQQNDPKWKIFIYAEGKYGCCCRQSRLLYFEFVKGNEVICPGSDLSSSSTVLKLSVEFL
jgi:hypothetical protein